MDATELARRLDRFRNRPAKKYRDELRFMEPYRRSGGLLDVGCGDGRFLLAAQGRGWNVSGIEIAEENALLCRDVFRLDVHAVTLEEASFDDGRFDVVRLNQVIEHVPSPLDLLREIKRVLRPGGLLSLATVNIESFSYYNLGQGWSYLGDPANEHICFFSRETLDRALSAVDLKSLKWKTKGFRLRNPGSKKGNMTGRGIRILEKALSPLASWTGRGGRIHVFAERRRAGPHTP
jgi:2-polyprenyl-3-methyl-5-hydroxy-6-metoxy-1,4-benzoquinol methylase